ncbi:FAD-dependent oxidoreductase [Cryptosporangium sp. NPDC048952]|uniref:FAD-dependent oxidoreductase n=1 Tax=Cryptosporangium sp. NPDC048952 TaxID=3363961 RepID=UPI00371FDD6F
MTTYDVVVVGGGAAGLAGAVALGRARRSVLVVDAGEQRNLLADGVHNFLTREGTPPAELAAAGRKEAESYGVRVLNATVSAAEPDGEAFRVTLDDGTVVGASRLLLATGVTDELPPVPGLAARWGRDLLHCPYCHGWEVRDRALGIISTGPFAVEQALLWRQWSADVTLFLHTGPEPTEAQYEQLAARGVAVVDGEITGVAVDDDRLTGVRISSRVVTRDALVTGTTMHASLAGVEGLGLVLEDLQRDGVTIGTFVKADFAGKTDVPGVYAAGNLTAPAAQVVASAAAGTMAGAMINMDLVARDTAAAVALRFSPEQERNVTERVLGERRHGLENTMPQDSSDELARTWDERYSEGDMIWSGEPNQVLVTEVADLTPGRVLDLGCGEGGDAVWFARQGWQVTAVDISQVALERAQRHAAEAGVGERIDFQRHNLAVSFPEGEFDLVSAQFLHSWGDMPREAILRRAAAAVAPGGVLLIEGHSGVPHWEDGSQPEHGHGGHGHPLPSPGEVIAGLALGDGWEVLKTDEHARSRTFPDGRTIHHVDNTVKLRRRVPSQG